jgi:hypothetical protein
MTRTKASVGSAAVLLVAIPVLVIVGGQGLPAGQEREAEVEQAPGAMPDVQLCADFGIPHSINCDKVTTYVCPDGTCLCQQQNCDPPYHNGDFAPCAGPPVAGCEHDYAVQYCFPIGQPIDCSANGVPVNKCAIPCRNGPVTYTSEPNGCCRGERTCLPPIAHHQPIDL